jgi:hypothetical protein
MTPMTIRDLTETEFKALRSYAEAHGAKWKDDLLLDWYHARARGDDGATLHALRNDPHWSHFGLAAFDERGPMILHTAPAFVTQQTAASGEKSYPAGVRWSGKWELPAIGNEVRIAFNGLGTGTVAGYFVEGGWLGLQVKLNAAPDWHIKQNGANPYSYVFGAEIDPVDIERDPLAATLGAN